jgi:hypothetical protein
MMSLYRIVFPAAEMFVTMTVASAAADAYVELDIGGQSLAIPLSAIAAPAGPPLPPSPP